jgi:hypothetical protein
MLKTGMRLVTREEYREFLRNHEFVEIENVKVRLNREWRIDSFAPKNFTPEEWSVELPRQG